jgi:hypothetical protein
MTERDPLFDKVKIAVRLTINDDDLNNELDDLIAAAREDLRVNGIVSEAFENRVPAMYRQAVILYVKANWGYDNPDAPRFQDTYHNLVANMSVHSQYDDEGEGTS